MKLITVETRSVKIDPRCTLKSCLLFTFLLHRYGFLAGHTGGVFS